MVSFRVAVSFGWRVFYWIKRETGLFSRLSTYVSEKRRARLENSLSREIEKGLDFPDLLLVEHRRFELLTAASVAL